MSRRQMYAAERVKGYSGTAKSVLRHLAYHSNDYGGMYKPDCPVTIPELAETLSYSDSTLQRAIKELEGDKKKKVPGVLDFHRGSKTTRCTWQLNLPCHLLAEHDKKERLRDTLKGKIYKNHTDQIIEVMDNDKKRDEIVEVPQELRG